ncbi:MAG: DUF2973 domain-containing protein [Cyanobacteria bacterium P01_C01_bin.120]
MLQAIYIIAFAVLSVLAISNLVRNIMMLGADAGRPRQSGWGSSTGRREVHTQIPHPEMLDDDGQVSSEPLLVMKSISLEDARDRLDALYEGKSDGAADEDA